MHRLEEQLSKNKAMIENLIVPDELESRLHNVLYAQTVQKGSTTRKIFIAAACLLILCLFTWSDTLAYYSQRLMGYDQVMNTTLQSLNKLGKGQKIGKSWQFNNGPEMVLDGIMLDDNQLIAFYTIKGSETDIQNLFINGMNGRFNHPLHSAVGKLNAKGTEIKYQASFASPYFFEKNLAFEFQWQDPSLSAPQHGIIDFALNRRQAMGHTLKKDLHINKKIGDSVIRFDSILASPTSTVITGTIASPWELVRDEIMGERIRPQNLEIRLTANQHLVEAQSAEISTGVNGIRFSYQFDALPAHLNSLSMQLKSITADFDVNQKININKEAHDESTYIENRKIIINKFEESNGDSYVTISSDDDIVLTRVSMIMDGKQISLNETNSDIYDKNAAGTVLHTRTLHFSGQGKELQLFVERMIYKADCQANFTISIQK